MFREHSLRVAAFGAFGFLILGAVATRAQSAAAPAHKQTTAAAKTKSQLEPKAIEVLQERSANVKGSQCPADTGRLRNIDCLRRKQRLSVRAPIFGAPCGNRFSYSRFSYSKGGSSDA